MGNVFPMYNHHSSLIVDLDTLSDGIGIIKYMLVSVKYRRNVKFLVLFMTDDDLDYDHLALGLKEALEKDKSAFDADRLQKFTGLSSRVTQCMASDSSSTPSYPMGLITGLLCNALCNKLPKVIILFVAD